MPVKIPVNGAGKPGNDYVLEQTFAESMVESLQQQRQKYVDLGDGAMVLKIDEQIDYYSGPDAPRTEGYEYVDVTPGQPVLVLDETYAPPAVDAPECVVDGCVLVHPHVREAILSADDAREAGLVLDRKAKGWREPRI
jgi:hypothetical protein